MIMAFNHLIQLIVLILLLCVGSIYTRHAHIEERNRCNFTYWRLELRNVTISKNVSGELLKETGSKQKIQVEVIVVGSEYVNVSYVTQGCCVGYEENRKGICKKCARIRFGLNCSKTCHCPGYKKCDHVTGECRKCLTSSCDNDTNELDIVNLYSHENGNRTKTTPMITDMVSLYSEIKGQLKTESAPKETVSGRTQVFTFNWIYAYSLGVTIVLIIMVLVLTVFCGKRYRKRRIRQIKVPSQSNGPLGIEINQLEVRPYHMYEDVNEEMLTDRQDQSQRRDIHEQTTQNLHVANADVDQTCPVFLGETDSSDSLDPCFVTDDGPNNPVSLDLNIKRRSCSISGDAPKTPKETDTRNPCQLYESNAIHCYAENQPAYHSLQNNEEGDSHHYQNLYQSLLNSQKCTKKAENLHFYKTLKEM